MRPSPELLTGVISAEYAEILTAATHRVEEETQTCGSDCTDGGECQDSTCSNQQEKQEAYKSKLMRKKKTFFAVVPGWNEPPAAYR
jgi:hypothetical protein